MAELSSNSRKKGKGKTPGREKTLPMLRKKWQIGEGRGRNAWRHLKKKRKGGQNRQKEGKLLKKKKPLRCLSRKKKRK